MQYITYENERRFIQIKYQQKQNHRPRHRTQFQEYRHLCNAPKKRSLVLISHPSAPIKQILRLNQLSTIGRRQTRGVGGNAMRKLKESSTFSRTFEKSEVDPRLTKPGSLPCQVKKIFFANASERRPRSTANSSGQDGLTHVERF